MDTSEAAFPRDNWDGPAGMTLRDWYIGQVAAALVDRDLLDPTMEEEMEDRIIAIGHIAGKIADELLLASGKKW